MKKTDSPIIVHESFDTSINAVWKAITEIDQMQKWYFPQIESFKPAEGFETEFAVQVGDKTFTHIWKIVKVEVSQLIKYQWRYKEYQGDSYVTFALLETDGKVNLKLTADVVVDFPDDIPEFKRESAIGGWNYFIKQSLKEYLS